jgi:signal transduction histidine kinase
VTGDSERIRFEVEDRGPGFADGELERVFEPFYSRGHKGDSLGLGLALVRRIADAHGGAAFAGNTDAGARVGFEIPRSAPPA